MLLPWHWLRTGVPGWDRSTQDQGAEFLSHLCAVLGGAEKLEEQYYAWLWWLCLSSVCFLNVLMLLRAMRAQSLHYSGARANAADTIYLRDMRCCATMFATSALVRSFWPRVDVERICFFDSVMSITLLGRSFAFCAEMCFAWQLSAVLRRIGSDVDTLVTKQQPQFAATDTVRSGYAMVNFPLSF
jgi:hypothetical protein